jgi:alanyl-tRNA synthetase
MRVLFSAGPRARSELATHDDALRTLARSLTCAPKDVALALDKVRRELDHTRETLGKARSLLAEAAAKDLWSEAERSGDAHVVASFDEGGVEFMRAVAARIVAHPNAVAMLSMVGPDGVHMLVDRGAASAFDCGAFVKRAASSAGGRGGGRSDHAEGRLPAGTDWPALARRLLAS